MSRTHTSPVSWTARGCPSAPLMTISLLGLTSISKRFACHKGISDTDAPVSKRTLVGGIVCETDLGGTFFETSKSYEGIELFSEDADILYSVRQIRPWVFLGGGILGSLPTLARLSPDGWNWAIGELPLGPSGRVRDLLFVIRRYNPGDCHVTGV